MVNRSIAAVMLLMSAALLSRTLMARMAVEEANITLSANEQELDRQRRWLETVIRTLPVGVIYRDAEGTNVRMNPAAAAMHGYAADQNLADVLRNGPAWRLERDGRTLAIDEWPLWRAVQTGQEVIGEELTLVMPDDRRTHEWMAAAPIRDRHGRIVGGVATVVDITTLKALQHELDERRREAEESAARKQRFLAAVSHDIRTPANAINLLAELLRRTAHEAATRPEAMNEIPEMVQDLQASALSMLHLVSDVLDVTRYDFGKAELNVAEFPLAEFLEEQARQHRPVAEAKGITVTVAAARPDVVLQTDRVKLGRVVSNLLGNAVKYTEKGGVTVNSDEPHPDGGLRITVADTGVGIGPEHLPRIFDEFYQIKNPNRERGKGTGLGLAIAKRLAETLGGGLSVESQPGEGTTFTITLPPATVVGCGGGNGEMPVAAAPHRDNAAVR
jgi:PAS domain S-box-containing protein